MKLNTLQQQIILTSLIEHKSTCDKVNDQVNIPNVEEKYMTALEELIKKMPYYNKVTYDYK